MSSPEVLVSASGLRPMSAFVVVAAVVLGVGGWTARLCRAGGEQPDRLRRERTAAPAYSIEDGAGRTIASFVPRFDLELSPRSLWQAHTPLRIAGRLSSALGGRPSPEELLERMLPDAREGVIEVQGLDLSPRAAERVQSWIESGSPDRPDSRTALEGIWIEPAGPRTWRLHWRPAVLLSEEVRRRHGVSQPWRWARRIADGLAACLSEVPAEPRGLPEAEARLRRDAIWKALLPTAHHRVLRGIDPEHVLSVRALLDSEGIGSWQMRVACGRDRAYPAGEHELYGSWGYLGTEPLEPRPREGLELLCDRLLASSAFAGLERRPAVYSWLDSRPVRGERAHGYVGFLPASPAPVVESTLELGLQDFLGRVLAETLETHEAALAMGIAVDVESGDVLAVDSVERYPVQPFAPVYHVFTTGSTFKVLTMAVALEEGVVEPDTQFEVGNGEYRITHPDGRPSARRIHEAEGALTGRHTAAELFAFSVNAGLAQVGLRIPDTRFRSCLARLGYGQPAGSGLGPERAGNLTPLPWKYAYTHASVGFGHEISSTLWQHASALATVIRGGVHRPLRVVRAVRQGGFRSELLLDAGTRLFRRETCESVREMMRFGARVGTGKEVREAFAASVRAWAGGDVALAETDFGSKTGTAEKVPSELCVHVELAERARWEREGLRATRERIDSLSRLAKPHARCYTSSICVFGRAPGRARELMVVVVVEEPRGKERFGSRVAGPAAQAILSEALGLTRNGCAPCTDRVGEFVRGAPDVSPIVSNAGEGP